MRYSVFGLAGLLLLTGCATVSSEVEKEDAVASPWICQQEEDAFGDIDAGCVSLGEIKSGARLAVSMVCSTRDGDDGVWDLNVIRATIRGDVDFGSGGLDEVAEIALDTEPRTDVKIYRRGTHVTIIDENWSSGAMSQWDSLMNTLENHETMTIRISDANGESHSGVITVNRLAEPLALLEGIGCLRNQPLDLSG